MRRKRLQHAVDIACHMLCGWRLMNDQKALTELGSGTLEIDLLTEECLYNGTRIEPLNIAGEIAAWLRHDLEAHRTPVEGIRRAYVRSEFVIRPLAGKRKAPEKWRGNPSNYIACDIRCESAIETDEKTYSFAMTDYEEWPENWWA